MSDLGGNSKRLEFSWELLDVIVSGKSLIDTKHGLRGFGFASPDDTHRFLLSYGFDVDDPIEQAEVLGNFREAVAFIRKYFLQPGNPQGLALDVPRAILELQDVRTLVLLASGVTTKELQRESQEPQRQLIRDFACACLKVMHAISHADRDVRAGYFAEVQKQIFDRFYKHIHRTPEGNLILGDSGDPNHVKLVAFETKPKKSRDSLLIKLLHKPENVADEIFDRVGIRFITETRLDAIRVVKFLQEQMIVMPANIKPSRSRNTLVDLGLLRQNLDKFTANETQIEGTIQEPRLSNENPHSSSHYRSIQFTSRQLIKWKNPLYKQLKDLKSLKGLSGDAADAVEKIDLKFLQQEVKFFYPYEVQIVDKKSHEENEKGRSAHTEYKAAQLQSALKRVMGDAAHGRS